jgi:geranylgeranyl diphosphate synthase type II
MGTSTAPLAPFPEYAQTWRPLIEEALARYAAAPPGCPPRLAEAMQYSLLAPGKRLRPLLVLMAAQACGGQLEAALPAACAVEMVHAYSLIHDDLPAMDDDDLRRGRPTNHVVFGEALAILAGDALLALAFEVLSREMQPPATAAACCAVLAQAAGRAALVGGQAADLEAEGRQTPAAPAADPPDPLPTGVLGFSLLQDIHRRKTGALFVAALRLGGLAAAASECQQAALEAYGTRLGLAFQICDDLLDVESTADILGKRTNKDAARGKLTFPRVLGIEGSRAHAAQLVAEACACLAPLGQAAAPLAALARYVTERDR